MDKRINIIKKKKPVKTEPDWIVLTGSTSSDYFATLNKAHEEKVKRITGPGANWYN